MKTDDTNTFEIPLYTVLYYSAVHLFTVVNQYINPAYSINLYSVSHTESARIYLLLRERELVLLRLADRILLV